MAHLTQPSLFEPPPGTTSVAVTDNGVVVRETPCKALLNQSQLSEYSFNCYTGCSHACAYCYARFMQRFHPHQEAWGKFVDVKTNAVEVLTRQLRRTQPGSVFTCSACDGWQPIERQRKLTRECCRLLIQAGFTLHILTKSDLVLRDLDILPPDHVTLGVTITTPDEDLARLWEPGAASVASRLNILAQAKRAGLSTTIMLGPLLPGLSDTDAALHLLFAMAADVRVDRVWTDQLNPRPRVWPSVQSLVRNHWPHLEPHYQRVLFDANARNQYRAALGQRVHRAAERTGLLDRMG